MNLLLAVAGKELLHIVRDRRTLALLLVLPTALTFIFGYAFQSGSITGVKTAVLDHDRSTLSLQIVRGLQDDDTFDVSIWSGTEEEARAALDRGDLKAIVILPAGLKAAAASGSGTVEATLDGVDTTSAPSVEGALRVVLMRQGFRMAGLKFRDLGLDRTAARRVLEPLKLRRSILFNPKTEFLPFVMPGIVGLILQLVTVILTANAITREKERGTFSQLSATPVSKGAVLVGKLVPYLFVSWVNVATILLVARYWFLVSFVPGLASVLLLCSLFIVSSLATGLLISAVCRSQTQAMQIAIFYCMPVVMLSGAYSPLEILPPAVRAISYTFPLTYFCSAFREVSLRGHGLDAVIPQMGAMMGFVVVMLSLAATFLRKQEA